MVRRWRAADCVIGIIVFAVPALEGQEGRSGRRTRVVAAKAGPEHRIGSYRLNRWNPAFRFYVDRHVVLLENPVEARHSSTARPSFYCVMHRSAYDEFVAQGAALTDCVYQRDGICASSGRALWRRRLSPAQFVVVEPAR